MKKPQLFRNLPWRPLGWLMRWLSFPTGQPFTEPSDRDGARAAALLLRPSDARERLTAGIFVSQDPSERVGQLERAFAQAALAAPIERSLRNARKQGLIHGKATLDLARQALTTGLIEPHELAILEEMERLRRAVIGVDAFDDLAGGRVHHPGLHHHHHHDEEAA